MKLTNSQMTKAIAAYARKYGYFARTVRDVSRLRYAAFAEYTSKHGN